jgi:DNA adenine methylase
MSELLHENGLVGVSYAEPYAGGAGLALRLLFEEYVEKISINDYDRSIYAFWHAVLNRTDAFCAWIDDVDVTIDNWLYYRDMQARGSSVDLFGLAKSTFFLNRTNVSGILKGGVIGGISQAGKYKIDARFNKNDLIARIDRISKFRDRISLSNLDGLVFLKKIRDADKDVFVYLDPPYYKKGADLYMNYFSDHDHRALAGAVTKLGGRWMVSYDNQSFIINLYSSEKRVLYKLSQSASNRVGDEVLIFSSDFRFASAVGRLASPVVIDNNQSLSIGAEPFFVENQ